jgi:hypothetical protein
MTMRTLSTKNWMAMALAALCGAASGCGQAVAGAPDVAALAVADEAPLPNLGVPACSDVTARPTGPVALEDIPGTARMVVHVGEVSLCAGTLEEIEHSGLLVAGGFADPGRRVESDPMPADGNNNPSSKASSDPMPADGSHVGNGNSDPMPASGSHSTQRSGTPPLLPR